MTRAELRLWEYLRRRQLEGFRFRRQVPLGPYIADFACLAARLVVEVDGSTHDDRLAYDARRTRFLNRGRLRVLRVLADDVDQDMDRVLEMILLELRRLVPAQPDDSQNPYRM